MYGLDYTIMLEHPSTRTYSKLETTLIAFNSVHVERTRRASHHHDTNLFDWRDICSLDSLNTSIRRELFLLFVLCVFHCG